MSNKLVKNGFGVPIIGEDEAIVSMTIYKSGKIQLQAPTVHPRDLCKMLHNAIFDLIYSSFEPVDIPKVQPPM